MQISCAISTLSAVIHGHLILFGVKAHVCSMFTQENSQCTVGVAPDRDCSGYAFVGHLVLNIFAKFCIR